MIEETKGDTKMAAVIGEMTSTGHGHQHHGETIGTVIDEMMTGGGHDHPHPHLDAATGITLALDTGREAARHIDEKLTPVHLDETVGIVLVLDTRLEAATTIVKGHIHLRPDEMVSITLVLDIDQEVATRASGELTPAHLDEVSIVLDTVREAAAHTGGGLTHRHLDEKVGITLALDIDQEAATRKGTDDGLHLCGDQPSIHLAALDQGLLAGLARREGPDMTKTNTMTTVDVPQGLLREALMALRLCVQLQRVNLEEAIDVQGATKAKAIAISSRTSSSTSSESLVVSPPPAGQRRRGSDSPDASNKRPRLEDDGSASADRDETDATGPTNGNDAEDWCPPDEGDILQDHHFGFGDDCDFGHLNGGDSPGAMARADQEKRDELLAKAMEAALEEQRQFADLRRLFEARLSNPAQPFAAPFLEIMEVYEHLAKQKQEQTGAAEWSPMTVELFLADSDCDGESISFGELLDIHPPDQSMPLDHRDGWASDKLLTVLISKSNASFTHAGIKAYIPSTWSAAQYLCAGGTNHVKSMDHIRSQLVHAQNASPDISDTEAADTFLAGDMPSDTERLMVVYNVGGNHWITLAMIVNATRTTGRIEVYNSRMFADRGPRTCREAAEEAEIAAQIVSCRPGLGWDAVQWQAPVRMPCPQQPNRSDCGFYAIKFARALGANSMHLVTNELAGKSSVYLTESTRWSVLQEMYSAVTGGQLAAYQPRTPSSDGNDSTSGTITGGKKPPKQGAPGGNSGAKGNASNGMAAAGSKSHPAKKTKKSPAALGTLPGATTRARARKQVEGGLFIGTEDDIQQDPEIEMDTSGNVDDLLDVDESETGNMVSSQYADIRQIICNIMLDGPDGWDPTERSILQSHLLDEVEREVKRLAREHNFSAEGEEESIRETTLAILQSSVHLFHLCPLRHSDANPAWRIHPGPGRRVDTATQQALLGPPPSPIAFDGLLKARFDLVVSIARSSSKLQDAEDFEELDKRCQLQFDAFRLLFRSGRDEARKVTSWQDMWDSNDLFPACWASLSYVGPSSAPLFSVPVGGNRRSRRCRNTDSIIVLLQNANAWALENQQSIEVALLQSGVDGSSSNNDTWSMLSDDYPGLSFRLVLVTEAIRYWNRNDFVEDPSSAIGWTMFDVRKLAYLWELWEAPELYDGHARFLTACALVNNYKEDCKMLNFPLAHSQNVTASLVLTGSGRKSFQLEPMIPRSCSHCGRDDIEVSAHAINSGPSLVLRCDDHGDEIEDGAFDLPSVSRDKIVPKFSVGPWNARASHAAKRMEVLNALKASKQPSMSSNPSKSSIKTPFAPVTAPTEGPYSGWLPCHQCPALCKTEETLARHLEIRHSSCRRTAGESGNLRCSHCGWANAEFRPDLEEHVLQLHSDGELSLIYLCSTCNRTYRNLRTRRRHQQEVHLVLKCPFGCPVAWISGSTFREHLRRLHEDWLFSTPLECCYPGCDVKYSATSTTAAGTLYRHIRKVHEKGSDPLLCGVEGCTSRHSSKPQMRRHRREHHPYLACNVEGCFFQARDSAHVAMHTSKAHKDQSATSGGAPSHGGDEIGDKIGDRETPAPRPSCCYPACNHVAGDSAAMSRHIRMYHQTPLNAEDCGISGCNVKISEKSKIHHHRSVAHPTIACNVEHCAFASKDPELMEMHRAKEHQALDQDNAHGLERSSGSADGNVETRSRRASDLEHSNQDIDDVDDLHGGDQGTDKSDSHAPVTRPERVVRDTHDLPANSPNEFDSDETDDSNDDSDDSDDSDGYIPDT